MNAAPDVASQDGRTASRVFDGAAVGVLAIVTVLVVLTFKDYGLGWDDYTHAEYGGLLVHLFTSGLTDRRAFSFVNLYAYGGGFDLLSAWASKHLPFDLWETRRLCGGLVGVVGLAATWRAGRYLGGPLAGLIAVALLATCPIYYGHMFMNPKDSPFAVAMAIALLGALRTFDEYPRPSPVTITMLGIGFGLAIGTRILGGFAVFFALIVLGFIVVAQIRAEGFTLARRNLGAFALALLPGIVLAYATLGLVWPWGVVKPLDPLRALLYFSDFFETPWKELYNGALISVPEMPRSYVPQLFALKMPEIMLLLSLSGIAAALVVVCQREVSLQRRAMLLFVVLAAIGPVLLTMISRPALYNGIRHFTFLTPPLAVAGGWFGGWVIAWLHVRRRMLATATLALIAAALIPPIVDMVRLHPYQYVSFNHIAGGTRAADERYMLDYWGLAFKQASNELNALLTERNEKPQGHKRWRIAVCGPQRPAQIELGPEFVVSWDPLGADFAMTLGEFYCSNLDAPVLVEIKRDGVIFARVYDIRGRSFRSVLTSGK
jgi:hypothetical protein